LVGAQLRYLVECEAGLWELLVRTPAFHLECRDQWIGWSPKPVSRTGERSSDVPLLIRSELRVRHLARSVTGWRCGKWVAIGKRAME